MYLVNKYILSCQKKIIFDEVIEKLIQYVAIILYFHLMVKNMCAWHPVILADFSIPAINCTLCG